MAFSRLLPLLLLCTGATLADTATLAVASNFTPTLRQLAQLFEQNSGHELRISSASTGKLYAQITHGAPFDLFLAADTERPVRLERSGLTLPGSRLTYALGRLALWAPRIDGEPDPAHLLRSYQFEHLSLANPKTAPYGMAAQQTLQYMGLWEDLKPRLVRGENVGQAYQFVDSGAAQLGFVALSQLASQTVPGYIWQVPSGFHQPIRQQAVLLKQADGNTAARDFWTFLQSPPARRLIQEQGYGVEAAEP
jgi:molybdate transport system substrate-binding protein